MESDDRRSVVIWQCSKCGEDYCPPTCDPCLAKSMMGRVRKYERIAREHQESAFNPNFRRLAYLTRKEMRELGLDKHV